MKLNSLDEITDYFPERVKNAVKCHRHRDKLQEIRIRAGCPPTVTADTVYTLDCEKITQAEVRRTTEKMCENSIYAMQGDIKNGFVTLKGGHRAGICGKTVVDNGKITHITDISSVNLRIARQVFGAADKVMNYILQGGLSNTIIISPPGCGKTTLLRDIARQLGGGRYRFRVGIADERGEIAAVFRGEAQNDVGYLSDVYDSCPKAQGMMMLIRGMSPQVIVTDELGDEEETVAAIINAGVKLICTAHGYDRDDLLSRKGLGRMIKDGMFNKFIVLSRRNGVGTIERMY